MRVRDSKGGASSSSEEEEEEEEEAFPSVMLRVAAPNHVLSHVGVKPPSGSAAASSSPSKNGRDVDGIRVRSGAMRGTYAADVRRSRVAGGAIMRSAT